MTASGVRRPYVVDQYLGSGGEGIVYRVVDDAGLDPLILKLFREPRQGGSAQGLESYASICRPAVEGLPRIRLVHDAAGALIGLWYPATPLHHVHVRLYRHMKSVATALLGSYCQMQAYLISAHGLAINDSVAAQFMLAPTGRFHYVDFGWGIARIDSDYTLRYGLVPLGLFLLLSNLAGSYFRPERHEGYRYDEPCFYFTTHSNILLHSGHRWVRDCAKRVLNSPASLLLEPEFYVSLADEHRPLVPHPRATIMASDLLYTAYTRLRHVSYFPARPPDPDGLASILDQVACVRGAERSHGEDAHEREATP